MRAPTPTGCRLGQTQQDFPVVWGPSTDCPHFLQSEPYRNANLSLKKDKTEIAHDRPSGQAAVGTTASPAFSDAAPVRIDDPSPGSTSVFLTGSLGWWGVDWSTLSVVVTGC